VDEESQNPNEELGEICHYRMRKHEKIPVKFRIFPLLLVLPAPISVLFMDQGFWICGISHPK
jgi:hypothetical protein